MTLDNDILRLLHADEERLREITIGAAADARVRHSLRAFEKQDAARSTMARLMAPSLAAGAAAALVVVGVYRATRRAPAPVEETAALGASSQRPAPCVVTEDSSTKIYAGRCAVRLPSLSVETQAGTTMRQSQAALRVVYGKADFEVSHVEPGHPAIIVRVGGGQIEVIGTRFEVDQRERDGTVKLFEGRIRFRNPDGDVTQINPGEEFRWVNRPSTEPPTDADGSQGPASSLPLDPPSAVDEPLQGAAGTAAHKPPSRGPSQPSEMRPKATSQGAPLPTAQSAENAPPNEDSAPPAGGTDAIHRDLSHTIDQVMRLRGQGRYQEAMTNLRKLPRSQLDDRTAEVLSFEEGNLLEHASDGEATCRHWNEHLRQFPQGSYRSVVETKIRNSCP